MHTPEHSDSEVMIAHAVRQIEQWQGKNLLPTIESRKEAVFQDIHNRVSEMTVGINTRQAYFEHFTEDGEHRVFVRPHPHIRDVYRVTANVQYHEPPLFTAEAIDIHDYLINFDLLRIIASYGKIRRGVEGADWSQGDMTGPRIYVFKNKLQEVQTDPQYLSGNKVADDLLTLRRSLFRSPRDTKFTFKRSDAYQALLCTERASELLARLRAMPESARRDDIEI